MLSVDYVENELAFKSREECLEFLQGKGVSFNADESKMDCKLSMGAVMAS